MTGLNPEAMAKAAKEYAFYKSLTDINYEAMDSFLAKMGKPKYTQFRAPTLDGVVALAKQYEGSQWDATQWECHLIDDEKMGQCYKLSKTAQISTADLAQQEATVIYGHDFGADGSNPMPETTPQTQTTTKGPLFAHHSSDDVFGLTIADFVPVKATDYWVCSLALGQASALGCTNDAVIKHQESATGICKTHADAWDGSPIVQNPKPKTPLYTVGHGEGLSRKDFAVIIPSDNWTCTIYAEYSHNQICGKPATLKHYESYAGVCNAHDEAWDGTSLIHKPRPRRSFYPEPTPEPVLDVKSQKAQGVRTLAGAYMSGRDNFLLNQAVRKATIWPQQKSEVNYPFFARPCPARPRHGFLDSRLIKSKKDWEALLAEVKACDEPDAEIIRMPYIDAEWSGILTPTGLTLGPGNDGATGGHASVSIPTATADGSGILRQFGLSASSCGIKDSPYIEIVCPKVTEDSHEGKGRPEAVQVRDGPKVSLSDRSVPFAMTVEHVVVAEGDLVAWETTAKKFKPGTVVWHPGGNLFSHYSVHCILNKVPILCTPQKPEVGSLLSEENAAPKLTEDDYKNIASYIGSMPGRITNDMDTMSQWCELGTAVLHGGSLWGNEAHLLRLRGAGIGAMMMLSGAAVLGELRHFYTHGPGRKGIKPRCQGISFSKPSGRGVDRTAVFEEAFSLDIMNLTAAVRAAYYDFNQKGWASGMGGRAWARCASATLAHAKAVGNFMAKPTEANYVKVMERMNRIVHVAHNGGLFLNKFMDTSRFDTLAKVPVLGFLNTQAARIALNADMPKQVWDVNFAKQLAATAVKPRGDKAKDIKHHTGKSAKAPDLAYSGPTGTFKGVINAPKNNDDGLTVQVSMKKVFNKPWGATIHIADDMLTAAQRKVLNSFPLGGKSLSGSGFGSWRNAMVTIGGEYLTLTAGTKTISFPLVACIWS